MRTSRRRRGATRAPATRAGARHGALVGLLLVAVLGLLLAAQQADSAYT